MLGWPAQARWCCTSRSVAAASSESRCRNLIATCCPVAASAASCTKLCARLLRRDKGSDEAVGHSGSTQAGRLQ